MLSHRAVSEELIRECEYSPAILARKTKIPIEESQRIIRDYIRSIDVRYINTDSAIKRLKKLEQILFERIIYYRTLIDKAMLHQAIKVEDEITELQSKYSSFNIYNS